MGTVIRGNERSWAIELITQINLMLQGMNIRIKKAGGESTLSVNKKSMFPDVILYEDEDQTKILQGWELKMPDVLITDQALINDAARKAQALGLNSFVIWNFTYGKLYIKDRDGAFFEAKVWNGTNHIKTRQDVTIYKAEWIPVIKDIILTVNEFLQKGKISTASIVESLSDNLMTELIQRNKGLVAENLLNIANQSMTMESKMKVWWNAYHEEFDKDETNMYSAYAKSILLNWTNRIMFANLIKKYHNCADLVKEINGSSTPEEANEIFDKIIAQGDFYNVFKKIEFNDLIPEDTWVDITDFNQFLYANKVENIDQSVLQDILEKTVNITKREIRGQYSTPYWLANFLCQITVENWNEDCADLCAGTGTIAKAIINNKMARLRNAEKTFLTSWAADKYAYPLQIANLALTSIDSLNTPLNLFQKDVFELEAGEKVIIRNPVDGTDIEREIPAFGAIVSNLPFIKYNNIAADEAEYIAKYRKKIYEDTGIEFTLGKADLYNFIPFKIYELLKDNGKLGIIISNSWLGTDIGRKFFDALLYYYNIKSIVLSDCGKWFENADVVATLLVLEKKPVGEPDKNSIIRFFLTQKELKELDCRQMEKLVHSIVLGKVIDPDLLRMKAYTLDEICSIQKYGITLNALFHNITWVEEIKSFLMPVNELLTVKRGERRGWNDLFYPDEDNDIEPEYIKPVLKNPSNLRSFMATTDITAFCCSKSKEELRQAGHFGALNWIEKFEKITNGTGKLLPEALKRTNGYWYEMDDSTKADFVTALTPDKRLFVARFSESTFVDQRFTRLLIRNFGGQCLLCWPLPMCARHGCNL